MAGFYIHNAPPRPEGKTSPSPARLPPPQRPEGGATGTSLPNGYLPQSPINPPHVGDACRLHLASSEGDGRSSRFVGCGAGATHSLRSPSRPASVYRNSGSPNPWSSLAAGFPIKGGGQVVMGGSHGSRPPSPQGRAPPFGKGRPGNMGWGVATMAPALRGGGGGPMGRQECRELGLGGWQGRGPHALVPGSADPLPSPFSLQPSGWVGLAGGGVTGRPATWGSPTCSPGWRVACCSRGCWRPARASC